MSKTFWPNFVTFLRVILVIPFIVLYPDDATRGLWLVVILLLCEATDAVDGMVARRLNAVSDFGKIFDPFCDAVYRQIAFLALMMAGVFPWWAFVVLIFRDMSVSYIRVWEASGGHVRAARVSGKIKAIVQGVALIVIAAFGATTFGLNGGLVAIINQLMIWSVVLVTLWSLVDYAQPLYKQD